MKRIVSISLIVVALAVVGMVPAQILAFGRAKAVRAVPCATSDLLRSRRPRAPRRWSKRKSPSTSRNGKKKKSPLTSAKSCPHEEKYTYNVCVPVTTQEKRNVTTYDRVTKEVEYKCTVMVPKTYQETRTVNYCEYETKMVKETVQVCKMVPVTTTR